MANPLFESMDGQMMNNNGLGRFLQEVKQFQQTFTGDPRAEVERLLNSGQLSQADFNRYSQMATQIMQMM